MKAAKMGQAAPRKEAAGGYGSEELRTAPAEWG